jgi:hypothetical protein
VVLGLWLHVARQELQRARRRGLDRHGRFVSSSYVSNVQILELHDDDDSNMS